MKWTSQSLFSFLFPQLTSLFFPIVVEFLTKKEVVTNQTLVERGSKLTGQIEKLSSEN